MNDYVLFLSISTEILNLFNLACLVFLLSKIYPGWKPRWSKDQVCFGLLVTVGVWISMVPIENLTGHLGWLIRFFYRKENGEGLWAEMTFFGIRDSAYLLLYSYLNLLIGVYSMLLKKIYKVRRSLFIMAMSFCSMVFVLWGLYTLPSIDQYKENYYSLRNISSDSEATQKNNLISKDL